jgi:O-antigen ligase
MAWTREAGRPLMAGRRLFSGMAWLSLALLFSVVVVHLRFVVLPVAFLMLGFASYYRSGRKALAIFLFLLPLINSTPDIFFNGYPFNYMAVSLFYLSGMMLASRLKREQSEFDFPGRRAYLLFLLLVAASVFFVFLRWSNLALPLRALLPDTPVAPSGERVSFAVIFPAITLALFSLSPFLAQSVRFWRLKEKDIFIPLKAGFCLSFLLALAQKWLYPDLLAQRWWVTRMNQVNGGFSDFNAFGFFAGAMFFYQTLRLVDRWAKVRRHGSDDRPDRGSGACWHELLFLAIALAAVFISGSRTAFLFVLLAVGYLVFSGRTGLSVKAAVILLLVGSLLSVGGTLKRRLQYSIVSAAQFSSQDNLFRAINEVTSGRLDMLRDSARMVGRFPVVGVGAGNFLFYLKYLRFHEDTYLDLPLNQYLLLFSETGLPGGLAFILFLALLLRRQKKSPWRPILAAIAFALLFNNFFWFPECVLLFWLVLAQADFSGPPDRSPRPVFLWALLAVFVIFQVLDFGTLSPHRLVREKGIAYDYGFWPPESGPLGRFSWTRAASGTYLLTGSEGMTVEVSCAAPPAWLRRQPMTVDVYWRGQALWPRAVFSENGGRRFLLPESQEGFLEIRVHPPFNIKQLGLGNDGRDLGVQFLASGRVQP